MASWTLISIRRAPTKHVLNITLNSKRQVVSDRRIVLLSYAFVAKIKVKSILSEDGVTKLEDSSHFMIADWNDSWGFTNMTGWPVALADVQTRWSPGICPEAQNRIQWQRRKLEEAGVSLFPVCLRIINRHLSRKRTGFDQSWKERLCYVAKTKGKYLDNTGMSRLDR